MNKIILPLFLILINVICHSQVNNGVIIYGKVNATMDLKTIPVDFREKIEKSNKESDKIEYTLNFVGNESYFFANPVLLENNTLFGNYVVIGGGKLKYYQNQKTKEYREYKDSRRTGINIINNRENYDWKLTNESKTIDGRICYKATSPQINQDGIRSTDPKFDIIAWYTPEIPVSLGPIGYGDLPGLILELQKPLVTFYVKKINLNLKKAPLINKLTDLKAISQTELYDMTKKTLTKEQLEGMEEAEQNKK